MTKDEKKLMEPFSNVLSEWDRSIWKMSDEDLAKLEKACSAASTTNCWAEIFKAAGVLLPMIRSAKHARKTRPA